MAARVLTAAALAALTPVQWVVAADYLSTEQAQRALYPQADRFEPVPLGLTPAQKQHVTAAAGPQPPHRSLLAWKAMRGDELLGHVFIDEVIGRQDFITYAVGIDRSGRLSPIEVLAYRESHGGEIRDAGWRGQFQGHDTLERLRFGIDIKNIAGATLSCEHVTEGVRWIVALYEAALRP